MILDYSKESHLPRFKKWVCAAFAARVARGDAKPHECDFMVRFIGMEAQGDGLDDMKAIATGLGFLHLVETGDQQEAAEMLDRLLDFIDEREGGDQ